MSVIDVSGRSRRFVKVDLEQSRLEAEHICSLMSPHGMLGVVKLQDSNRVQVSSDRGKRMWYPPNVPTRIHSSQLVHCVGNIEDVKEIEWSKILSHLDDVDVAEMDQRLRTRFHNGPVGEVSEDRRRGTGEKLEIALPGSANAIAVSDGGTCELLGSEKSLSLVVDVPRKEDFEHYRRMFFKNALQAYRLRKSDNRVLANYLASSKMEKMKNAALIQFASLKDCEEALKSYSSHGGKGAKYLPRAFIAGYDRWNTLDNAVMCFNLKWYDRPSNGVGVVRFKSAGDAQTGMDVFMCHGYTEEERERGFGDDVKVIKYVPICYQPNTLFEKHVRDMMEANDIHIEEAYLQRNARCNNAEVVQQFVGREILNFLISHDLWHDEVPWLIQEWRALISSSNVPWRWNMLRVSELEGIAAPAEAEMILDNAEHGLRMVQYLIDRPRTWYNRKSEVFQKVYIRPMYCILLHVTKEIRAACDSLIRKVREEEMAEAQSTNDEMEALNIVDITWDRAHNNCDDLDVSVGELSVRGWPVRRVKEAATRLISMFNGTYLNCSDDVYGRLLFGYGARYVEFVREKLRGKVVIDVDLMRERITVVGESADLAKEKLRFFAENSHAFKVDEIIFLGPPRYSLCMRQILCSGVGIERVRKICGGADLEFVDDVGVKFSGTLEQYELLTNYLKEVNERVVSRSSNNSRLKGTCPVCLSPISSAFYILQCAHGYCLKCLIYQIKIMIRDRMLPIRCIYQDCEKPIAVSDLKELILGEERVPWLSAGKLRALIDSTIDCIIRENANMIRCPTPDCFGVCDITGNSGVFQCESCKKERCTGCMMEPHENLTCEEYSKLRSDDNASIKFYLSSNEGKVRECPTEGCGAIIEKGEGCFHMLCSVCKIHFCWLCGFSDAAESNVYGHLREIHGGFGAEWPVEFEVQQGL